METSEIKLEVNLTENCEESNQDRVTYSIHYDGADNNYFLDREGADTNVVFYTWYGAGLRAFDVRDPVNPKEIAYYKPKPVQETILTEDQSDNPPPYDFTARNEFWDGVTSTVRYRPERGEVWVVSVGGGFQVLKLTKQAGDPVKCGKQNDGVPGNGFNKKGKKACRISSS